MGLESIAFALIKTLTSFVFSQILSHSSVSIDGAPDWFMKENRYQMCASAYKYGDLSSIEIAKSKSIDLLKDRVENLLIIVVNENIKNATPEEKVFLEAFVTDRSFEIFIMKNTNFKDIKYDKKHKVSFVRACIDREEFLEFEKKKIDELKKKLTIERSNKAFEELENEN